MCYDDIIDAQKMRRSGSGIRWDAATASIKELILFEKSIIMGFVTNMRMGILMEQLGLVLCG